MLFHVTIRHDAAHCPGFHPELMPKAIDALENIEATAAQFGVTVNGLYNALPDHVEYLIAEADSPAALAMYLSEAVPYGEADTETHAVVGVDELRAAARAMSST
jgi:hypothetical protein